MQQCRDVFLDLLWADPATAITEADLDERGFGPNQNRGVSHIYGQRAVDTFLEAHGLLMLLRAHEKTTRGFTMAKSGKVVTVFTSSKYCGTANWAGLLHSSTASLPLHTGLTRFTCLLPPPPTSLSLPPSLPSLPPLRLPPPPPPPQCVTHLPPFSCRFPFAARPPSPLGLPVSWSLCPLASFSLSTSLFWATANTVCGPGPWVHLVRPSAPPPPYPTGVIFCPHVGTPRQQGP